MRGIVKNRIGDFKEGAMYGFLIRSYGAEGTMPAYWWRHIITHNPWLCRLDLKVRITDPRFDNRLRELLAGHKALTTFGASYEAWRWEGRSKDDFRLLRTGHPHKLAPMLVDVDGNDRRCPVESFIGRRNGYSLRLDKVAGAHQAAWQAPDGAAPPRPSAKPHPRRSGACEQRG
jgi:hypothetical protein